MSIKSCEHDGAAPKKGSVRHVSVPTSGGQGWLGHRSLLRLRHPVLPGLSVCQTKCGHAKAKTAVMHTAPDEGKVIVRLQGLESKQSLKDQVRTKFAGRCCGFFILRA